MSLDFDLMDYEGIPLDDFCRENCGQCRQCERAQTAADERAAEEAEGA